MDEVVRSSGFLSENLLFVRLHLRFDGPDADVLKPLEPFSLFNNRRMKHRAAAGGVRSFGTDINTESAAVLSACEEADGP